MITRRAFLRTTTSAGAAALGPGAHAMFRNEAVQHAAAAERLAGTAANGNAANEDYWREIQQAFTLDRTIVNLNNGGCCPSPRVVHEALKR
jgi:hypothetical protein